ncbi:heterokaryon incompatibility protein-domain-containing protein [Xylaria telfairii]|nr:heterokaryon incompatibility protein-domain-containing protein [Xylaria telfairii]
MDLLLESQLCCKCRDIDIASLVTLPPTEIRGSRRQTLEYEDQLSVHFHSEQPYESLSNSKCGLCNLVGQCAIRTRQGARLNGAECCLRPKLVWLADPSDRNVRLRHSGQIQVLFFEVKSYPYKWYIPYKRYGILSSGHSRHVGERSTVVSNNGEACVTEPSPVASWMIDVINKQEPNQDCQRSLIPATANVALLRDWLQLCDTGHHHSNSTDISPRLRNIQEAGLLRAINTTTGIISKLPLQHTFVSLSYVWGSEVTQHQSLQSLPVAEYAPTIRDAIEVAASLDFEWIWVDRICIDQKNEAEKSALIPFIKDIFAAAALTIVAACGDGAHGGLSGSSRTVRRSETPLELQSKGEQPTALQLLPACPSFNTLHEECIWRTRGWTFEEQVFSRRLLFVFPSEMIFTCSMGTYRESNGSGFVSEVAGTTWGDFGTTMPLIAGELFAQFQPRRNKDSIAMNARQFIRAVEEYSSRNLTIESDRIAAFAGLVAVTTNPEDGISDNALLGHGHPLRFFETALTWQHDTTFHKRINQGKCFAPSWSWASAEAKVHFLDNGDEDSLSNWFSFGLLNPIDVLGLPSRDFLSNRLGLNFPSNLLAMRPWIKDDVPNNAPPVYDDAVSSAVSYVGSQYLPKLHIVTVLFNAYFGDASDGQHYIQPIGADQDELQIGFIRGNRMMSNWSASSVTGNEITTATRKFAIVGGCHSIYVMALESTEEHNTFQRKGLTRISAYSDEKFFKIMKKGSPRWEYIRIV